MRDIASERCWNDASGGRWCHVGVYDNDEHLASVSIKMGCEVTVINPAEVIGWPGDFTEGFIRIPYELLGLRGDERGAFGFSIVHSGTMNAAQTLLAAEGCRTLTDED